MAFDTELLRAEVHREFSLAQMLKIGEENFEEAGLRLREGALKDRRYRARNPKANATSCKSWRSRQPKVGRQPAIDTETLERASALLAMKLSLREIARTLGVARSTLTNALRRM